MWESKIFPCTVASLAAIAVILLQPFNKAIMYDKNDSLPNPSANDLDNNKNRFDW